MPERGLHVNKYAVSAAIRPNAVTWVFSIETSDGERFDLDIVDGSEIPLLLDMMRRDQTVFFDPATRTLSTGWNDPGE